MTLPKTRRGSLSSKILAFLAAHPDQQFRCFEIAAGIRRRVQPTANECARLARAGRVTRVNSEDRRIPTFYSLSVGPSN